MHRATPLNIAFRAYSAGGARTSITSVDDSKLMQQTGANFMTGESREKIESPQNYGFTSVNMPPTMGSDGQMTDSAESIVSFVGGSRSLPIMGPTDDRRHRLYGLEHGDVAMFRSAQDQLQLHLAQEGGFLTGPDNKKLRMQLVKQQQQQGGSGSGGSGGSGGSSKDASSSGGSGSGSGAGAQQQQKGQKAQYKQDSNQYIEISGTMAQYMHKQHQIVLTDKKTGMEVNSDNNVYLGALKANGTFLQVVLKDGSIAKNVYGLKTSSTAREGDDSEPSELLLAIRDLSARVKALENTIARINRDA
jgi:hypothetical protein